VCHLSGQGGVAGERPTSVPKVSLIGSLASTTFVAACSSLSLLIGMDPWMWTAFDYAFWSLGAGALTAMLSQMHFQLKIPRNSTIPKREEIEQKMYDLPMSEIGNGTLVEVGYSYLFEACITGHKV
jgi:hypothetical protein